MDEKTRHAEQRRAFGEAIAAFRKSQHISQEQLALSANIDRSYMGRIERGEQSVSFDKILDIAEALATTPAALFAHYEESLQDAHR